MDEQQLAAPERWIDARRAVRAIEARGGWTPSLTASGLRSGVFHLTPDGQAVAMTELLQGVRMVHRLTAGEVAGGFLLLEPDLTVFEAPVAVGVRTTCGEPLSLGIENGMAVWRYASHHDPPRCRAGSAAAR